MGVRKHEFSTYHVKGNREIKTHKKTLFKYKNHNYTTLFLKKAQCSVTYRKT